MADSSIDGSPIKRVVLTTADGTPVYSSGSVGTAVDVTNLPDTVDTNSGNKSASTIRAVLATDQPALTNALKTEQQFSGTKLAADGQVKGAAGFLHTLTFSCNDAAPTAGSIIVYDSLTETGTELYNETFTTTPFRGYSVLLDVAFATGLYVGFTTTNDVNVTISFR